MDIWFPIPGFKLYAITKTAKVKNIATGKVLTGGLCGSGYLNYHIYQDNGTQIVVGAHRLMAFTFIPNDDPEKIYVNHIDGNKLNNAIENLEWVTPLENAIHAGKFGLSSKCLGITVRNPRTNEIRKFDTIRSAGDWVGLSRDAMRFRYWKLNGRVFPEGFQYQKGDYSGTWNDPLDIDAEGYETRKLMTARKATLLKNLKTGEIKRYQFMSQVAKKLDISVNLLSPKLGKINCPCFPPHYQVKYDDDTPWRTPDSLPEEFKRSLGIMTVVVEDAKTGKKKKFFSHKELMEKLNMTKPTLLSRLRNGKRKTVDGFYYYHSLSDN